MPFNLKNIGIIFQRMVNKIFAKQIGKNVKAYINDIVVKSEKKNRRICKSFEVFNVLRKFEMKLNPESVHSGYSKKILGIHDLTERNRSQSRKDRCCTGYMTVEHN